eukprot:1195251-Prorocentrum_minimum.AAC.13
MMPAVYPFFLGKRDRTDPAEAKKEKGRETQRAFRKKRELEDSEEAKQIRIEKQRETQRVIRNKRELEESEEAKQIRLEKPREMQRAIRNTPGHKQKKQIYNAVSNPINNAKLKAE